MVSYSNKLQKVSKMYSEKENKREFQILEKIET